MLGSVPGAPGARFLAGGTLEPGPSSQLTLSWEEERFEPLVPGTRKRRTEGAILCCVFANADRMSFGEGAAAGVLQLSFAGIRHDGPPEPPCGKPDDRQREDSSNRVPSSSESVNFGDLGEETRLAGRGVLVVARCLVRGEGRRFGPAPACLSTASVGGPLPRAFFRRNIMF